MSWRPRTSVVVTVACLAIVAVDRVRPIRFLDTVRFHLAALAATPLARLARRGEEHSLGRRELETVARYDSVWRASGPTGPTPEGTLPSHLIDVDVERHLAFVAIGREAGVRRGDAVSAAGVLLGLVQRTNRSASAVLLLSSPKLRFTGRIARGGDEAPLDLLLQGAWRGVVRTIRGQVIPRSLCRRAVVTSAGDGIPAELLLGWTEYDADLGEVIVRLADIPADLDRVVIHPRVALPAAGAPAATSERVVHARIVSAPWPGDPNAAFLIDAGTSEKVRDGDWVTSARVLLGRVTRVGAEHALCVPVSRLPDGLDALCIAAANDGRPIRARVRVGRETEVSGIVFARGGADFAPRGVFAGTVTAPGEWDFSIARRRLFVGSRVTVHSSFVRDDVQRLGRRR